MKNPLNLALILLSLGTVLFVALLRPHGFQWDLLVFYRAGLAWRNGLNPYDFQQLITAGLIDRPAEFLTFTYLPFLAAVFAPLSFVSFSVAAALWIAIKGLFFALFWKSATVFHRFDRSSTLDLCVLVLGFNSALFSDVLSGNMSLILCAILWWGLKLFFEEKYYSSAAAVAAASLVKIQPIALLAIFIVSPQRPKWRPAFFGAALFAVVLALNAMLWPEMFRSFIHEALHRTNLERGILAPSLFALCADTLDQWKGISVIPASWKEGASWLPLALYLIGASVIGAITALKVLRHTRRLAHPGSVALVLLAWVLLVPRLKSYDFILLLPVAGWILSWVDVKWKSALITLTLLPVLIPIVHGPVEIFSIAQLGVVKKALLLVYQYLPWFATLGYWLALLRSERFTAPR